MEEDEEIGIGWRDKHTKEAVVSSRRGPEGTPKALFIWEAFLSSSAKAGQPEYHMVLFDLNLVLASGSQRKTSLPNYFTSFSLSLLESPQLLVPLPSLSHQHLFSQQFNATTGCLVEFSFGHRIFGSQKRGEQRA